MTSKEFLGFKNFMGHTVCKTIAFITRFTCSCHKNTGNVPV